MDATQRGRGLGSPAKLRQLFNSSDVSDLQSPMDGGKAVMMISDDVAWVLQRADSLTCNGSPSKVEVLQILQLANLVRDG